MKSSQLKPFEVGCRLQLIPDRPMGTWPKPSTTARPAPRADAVVGELHDVPADVRGHVAGELLRHHAKHGDRRFTEQRLAAGDAEDAVLEALEDVAPDVDPLVDGQLGVRGGKVFPERLLAGRAAAVGAGVIARQRRRPDEVGHAALGRLQALRAQEARNIFLDVVALAFEGLLQPALIIDLPLGRPVEVAGVIAALVVAHRGLDGTLPAVALQVGHRRPPGVVICQTAVDVAVGIDVEVAHTGRTQHVAGELKRHRAAPGRRCPRRRNARRGGRRLAPRIG